MKDINTVSPFSQRVREESRKKGITRAKLAEMISVSLSTINSYIRKKNPVMPTLYNATRISEVLGISLDYLAGVGETKELAYRDNISSEILLKNLYTAVNSASLKVDFDKEQTIFISDNQFVQMFFKQIGYSADRSKLNKVAANFSNLKVWGHTLLDETSYYYTAEIDYVNNDISNEDRENYPEECREDIERRKAQWEAATTLKEKDKLIETMQRK